MARELLRASGDKFAPDSDLSKPIQDPQGNSLSPPPALAAGLARLTGGLLVSPDCLPD